MTWVAPLPQDLSQGSSSNCGQGMMSSQGWTWVCWRVCCQIQSHDCWPKSVTSESLDWGLRFLPGIKPKASLSLLTWVSSWNSSKRDSCFRQSKQKAKRQQVTSVGEDVEKTEPLWKCKYLLSVTSVDINWTCRRSKDLDYSRSALGDTWGLGKAKVHGFHSRSSESSPRVKFGYQYF